MSVYVISFTFNFQIYKDLVTNLFYKSEFFLKIKKSKIPRFKGLDRLLAVSLSNIIEFLFICV